MTEHKEIKIDSMSHDGRGIATIDGKTTFIVGALPDEIVTYKIVKKHKRYNDAQIVQVISPSPSRETPRCAHFGVCGGCTMQHLKANDEIEQKQKIVLEQLKHFGRVVPEKILAPITGNPWGYRRKARLGVRYVIKKGELFVGFREQASNYLTNIQHCPVLYPSIGTKLVELNHCIRSLSQYEHIAQVEVAVSDEITALIFRHLTPLTESDLETLYQFGKQNNFHIYLQPDSMQSIHKIWPDTENTLMHYLLPDYQLEMRFYPTDFTQVNSEINRLMINKALELLQPEPNDTILDLFCGLGNFTLPLAKFAKRVIGIEGSNDMVKRAEDNALHNKINNTEFYAANLMEPSEQANWVKNQYDKILLDPPRSGAKEIIALFSNWSAKKVVYVSCNPATLARDAGDLVYNHQYKLKEVGVINMFPHTSHIETIALFEK